MKNLAICLTALTAGCLDLGEVPVEDPPPEEPAPQPEPEPEPLGPDFDFTNATWSLSNVSQSEGTLSHDGQFAFFDRFTIAVFSEPLAEDFGDQDIHRAVRSGNTWQGETLTLSATTQLAFPAIAANGNTLWTSWTGRADDESNLEIWLRSEQLGGGATEPRAITPTDGVRQSHESRILPRADGGVDIIYLSHEAGQLGNQTDHDIRWVEVDSSGNARAPQRLMAGRCRGLRSAGDTVVAMCGSEIVSIRRDAGGWSSQTVDLGVSRSPTAIDIDIDSDGAVHLVWAGSTDCGEETCRRVFYSKAFTTPEMIGDEAGFMPVVGVDLYGRPVVAFHRTGDDPAMMISHKNPGAPFAMPRRIAQSGDRDTSASQLSFDATGRPHLFFDRIYSGSSPLNGEVTHARID